MDDWFIDLSNTIKTVAGNTPEQNQQYVKDCLVRNGWVHIPTAKGKSVTVYTSDNPEPLMTEDEWRAKNG